MTIRDGIEREMARGGQVFYLYNRVETIEKKADELRALVPGCRVGVIHGPNGVRRRWKIFSTNLLKGNTMC